MCIKLNWFVSSSIGQRARLVASTMINWPSLCVESLANQCLRSSQAAFNLKAKQPNIRCSLYSPWHIDRPASDTIVSHILSGQACLSLFHSIICYSPCTSPQPAMKTPLNSPANQILRLVFKLWLDLALEGRLQRFLLTQLWYYSSKQLEMQQVMATLTQPIAQSHDWIFIDNAGFCFPQWSASVFLVILGCSCCSQKNVLLFFVLSLEKKKEFYTSLSILGMDLMRWCLSFWGSVPLRLPGRGRPPCKRQQRERPSGVWDGLWSGISSFVSLGAGSVWWGKQQQVQPLFQDRI